MSNSRRILLYLCLAGGVYTYGVLSAHLRLFPYQLVEGTYQLFYDVGGNDEKQAGSWFSARGNPGAGLNDAERRDAIANMSTLPYLKGYREATETATVTVYDEDAAFDGLNLLVSGHAPEAVLTDMHGNEVHTWSKEFAEVWPESPNTEGEERYKTFWNRVHLFDNGDLLAIFRDFGLIKLDNKSRLLWKYDGRCHHDLSVTRDGSIYVLTRETRKKHNMRIQSWRSSAPIWEDFVVVLDRDGTEKRRISILKCFLNSEYAPYLEHLKVSGNILHTNALKYIDAELAASHPQFEEGDVLISCREIHTIAVLNLKQERVVWAMTGMWKYQHEPTLLANGNILLFDNRGYVGRSKILEFNPKTQAVSWSFKGNPPKSFYSQTAGTCRRLDNGNTLIVESNNGRVFEVDSDGTIVWELYNPHRAGEDNELIAALYDVIRVKKEQVAWLDATNGQ